MRNYVGLFLLVILLFPFVGAVDSSIQTLGIFEQSTDIELTQLCSNSTALCDYCNISSIKYPNSSSIFSDVEMTSRTADFNYTLILNYTEPLGEYDVLGHCGFTGGELKVFSYSFEVTVNGNEKPEGNIVIFFTLLFTFGFMGLLVLIFYNLFHIMQWDLDAKDLMINLGVYFAVFLTYIFGREYLGNSFFNSFLIWMIGATAFTSVVLPAFGFGMSYIKGGLDGMKNV